MTTNPINSSFTAKGQVLVAGGVGSFAAIPAGGSPLVLTSDSTQPEKLSFQPIASIQPWTPSVFGSTGAGTATYSTQNGVYVTLGSLIFVWGQLQFTSFTGTGGMQLSVPFAIGATAGLTWIGSCTYDGPYDSGNLIDTTAQIGTPSHLVLTTFGSGIVVNGQSCVAAAAINFFTMYSLQ